MLHAAETWAVTVSTLNRLNDLNMIHWMYNVRANDDVHSNPLLPKLGMQNVEVDLPTSRMSWFRYVEHSSG